MDGFPIFIEPYPDELLYSWICRLARANGLPVRMFCNIYLGSEIPRGSDLKCDVRAEFPEFYKRVSPSAGMLDAYLSATTLAYESAGMSPYGISRYINSVFQPHSQFNDKDPAIIKTVRICPVCTEEDRAQYGEPYLHRAHQLSGVCVCHKHGVPLLEYAGKKSCGKMFEDPKDSGSPIATPPGMAFNMKDYRQVPVIAHLDASVAYAQYADGLLQGGTVTDSHKVALAIHLRMEELGLDLEHLLSGLKQWKYSSLFGDTDRLSRNICFGRERYNSEAFLYLMFLFPDPADATAMLKELGPSVKQYTCPVCGTVYCASSRNRWVCPKCTADLTEQELFELLVSVVGNGECVALDPFRSLNDMVMFRNVYTGEEKAIRLKSFLFRGTNFSTLNGAVFERSCNAYRHYVEEFGTAYVPYGYKYDGVDIGRWFFRQRKFEREGKMSPSLKEKLLDISLDFFSEEIVPKPSNTPKRRQEFDRIWRDHYDACLRYIEQTGSLHIPNNAVFEGCNIGKWINYQRTKGRFGKLLPVREQLLLGMDPDFFSHEAMVRRRKEDKTDLADKWDHKYRLYKQYTQENKTFYLRVDTVYRGEKIGMWLSDQRKRERAGELVSERRAKLLSVDPDVFSPEAWEERMKEHKQYEAFKLRWKQKCAIFEQYVKEKGDVYVAFDTEYCGIRLGLWVFYQRNSYKKGTLSEEYARELLEIDPDFFNEDVLHERTVKCRRERKQAEK